tara:strand:- start:433 stop:2178 length:1746 start_codon:yes stop_codon:yes gene_type:complete
MLLQPVLAAAGVSEGVSYLEAQTQDPWITMALVAAGESGISTSHLTSVSGTTATDYAKTILALAAVNENPATFGVIDFVAELKSYHQGGQMGDDSLINDDAWSILALSSVGESGTDEMEDAKDFILDNQNPDGGWSWGVGGASDTNDTSAMIMALIESGVSAGDSVITSALNYLEETQNDDGGFGFDGDSDSDSGSDSWVIAALIKAGINPNSWQEEGNSPIDHLETLQDDDGGFWWVPEGESEFNNKAMTAFAVVALSGSSYPVGYFAGGDAGPLAGTFSLRIEGASRTICDSFVEAENGLDIVENGSEICDYTYTIEDTAFGPYLSEVAGEAAEGLEGWLYLVDYVSPPIGAADYVLVEGEEVLWYYGEWGISPLRLIVSDDEVDSGDSTTITVEYYEDGSWLPLAGATIKGADQDYTANGSGQLALGLDDGFYNLYAEEDGYVRSAKVGVTFGEGVSGNIGLTVEIDQGGGGGGGDGIGLDIDTSSIDFGILSPGEIAESIVGIIGNVGTIDITVSASVSGDTLFTSNLTINAVAPSQYSQDFNAGEGGSATVALSVPENYLGSGVKNGELIFWATPQ